MSFRKIMNFVPMCLLLAMPMAAQTTAAPAAPLVSASGTRVHGTITDPDGELIPGATIQLTPAKGSARTVVSGSDGTYSVTVPPGSYTLVVSMKGFSSYSLQNMKVPAVPSTTVDARLKIGTTDEVINVDASASQLSVDPDNNASATIITGDALAALSDDPDDLAEELSALAGPAAGPNGGTIYIDGFTGGQLPPKASIREIRINQNPFSAQYDKPGFGRVEVFTKPGSDSFHGSASMQGNDNVFNTGSPIISSDVLQPGYHTLLANGQLSGPISKSSSFTFGFQYRNIHNNAIIDPENLYSETANPGTPCPPGTTTGCSVLPFLDYVAVVSAPDTRYDISPRVDLALGPKNTLTMRYRYEKDTANNQGIGGNQLPDNAYSTLQSEQDIQISDTQTVTDKIINEIHFEWQRSVTGDTPLNTTPELTVTGGFLFGGDGTTGLTNDTQNHIEFQNYTSIALKKNFIRLGGRLRTTSDTNTTNAGSNGLFTYNSTQFTGVTYNPNQLNAAIQNYIQGLASNFTYTLYNHPTTQARTTDLGLYAEDDWKIKPNLTFSYGVRFETQNFINDKDDWAPRLSVAYGVGKKKSGGPLIVLRGGFGLFYDRLLLANQLDTVQQNGVNQIPETLASTITGTTATPIPAGCNPNSQTALDFCITSAGATGHLTTQTVQPNYHSPYQMQTNLGLDEQPFRNATISVNYQNVRGIHQLINDNINATAAVEGPNAGSAPIVDQYLSEGYYRQNQLITNFNYRGNAKYTLSSYYVVNFDTKSDTAGVNSFPTNPYNIGADFGRASFDIKNQLFLFGNFNLPYLISLSPLVSARSGQPINITTGGDNFGYLTYNTRPVFAAAGTPGAKTFAGCGTFVDPGNSPNAPYAQIPANYCTGPAVFTANLRITKGFGFGKKASANTNQGGGDGGPGGGGRGPGGGGVFGGGGGGGRGGGGGGGGRGPGGLSSGKKYNFVIGAQIQNLFNVADRGAPNGVLSSSSFGQLTTLAGGLFTTNEAVRRIQLTASFNF